MALLEVKDLRVHFKIHDGWVKAVDGVSFSIDSGQTMGLVGESGCGKTTAAYAITQLLPPNGHIKGGHIFYKEPEKVAAYRREYEARFEASQEAVSRQIADATKALAELVARGKGGATKAEEEKLHAKLDKLEASRLSGIRKAHDKELRRVRAQAGAGGPDAGDAKLRLAALENRHDLLSLSIRKDGTLDDYNEDIRKIRWTEISMIFQGAMNAFNPVFKVGDQIKEAIQLHEEVDDAAAEKRAKELFEFVGINPDRIGNYPHEFSGGMKQRAMIALALALSPSFIIADEPTTALDVITQDRILVEIKKLQQEWNMAMMIITHDVSVVAEVSDMIGVMYAGMMMELGGTPQVFKNTAHPYTAGLLNSFPSIKGPKRRLASIPGFPPDLVNPPSGCPFHPRCQYAQERCRLERPKGVEIEPGHTSFCHFAAELWDRLRRGA
ncbi:MAG: oligopeptide/dipeptide ABC transporter ATP-binding protein [Candidatus Thermoplasmatota archaeon]